MRNSAFQKKSLEDQLDEFLDIWDLDAQSNFFKDIFPVIELYNIKEGENDWVEDLVGPEERDIIRLVRSAYLISKIAEYHSGKLAKTKARCPDLWKKMEKEASIATNNKLVNQPSDLDLSQERIS